MKKIAFTGGHHNSALSVAQTIKNEKLAEVIWFGHKHTMLGDKNVSAEYQEVTKSEIPFFELHAGKFYRTLHPVQLLKIPFGLLQAFYLLIKEKPSLIVSFGGYLAAPVVIAGWFLRIPSVTHEQTTVVGLANRLIARFAKKIYVTWPQSKKYFNPDKVVLSGLPLRQSMFANSGEKEYFDNELKTIYVTGGKQGSHAINSALHEALPELLESYNVIHQVGSNSKTKDFEHHEELRKSLPENLQERYMVKKYVFEEEIGQIFFESDIVISRAGAHIVYELAALGIPTLFVPIPWVSHNEQYKNARLLVNAGSARLLPEDRLSKSELLSELSQIKEQLDFYASKGEELKSQVILDGRQRIVDGIVTFLEDGKK